MYTDVYIVTMKWLVCY